MVAIETYENNVGTGSEHMVLVEHLSEVSADATESKENSNGTEAKELLVQRRASTRIQDLANKRSNCATNTKPCVQKKAKTNHSVQQRALVKKYVDFHVFDEIDFRAILRLKKTLIRHNECLLQPEQGRRHTSKKVDNKNREVAILSKSKLSGYLIEDHVAGRTVSKYLLEQLRGLAVGEKKVVIPQVELPRNRPYPWLVCKDLSNGKENICIPVLNEIDDPPIGPTGFTYITSMQVASNVKLTPSASGCQCKGRCTYSTCSCARRNVDGFPYVHHNGGRLTDVRDIVHECGPSCGCRADCGNKISQMGLKYRLEVYCTPKKGWSVRTLDFIPSGAPVCEYIGVLRRTNESEDNDGGNDYIFNIDVLQIIKEKRQRDVSPPKYTSDEEMENDTEESEPEFCIDAGSCGNISRFINHSCDPNLYVQGVLSPHLDIKQARVVLFAYNDIQPYEELSYDYGFRLDSVLGPDDKVKQLPCYCGAANCRKRLY